MIGVIEVYFAEKGFGFAKYTGPNGIRQNYFFHINDVISGEPQRGAEIHFDEDTDKRKPGKTPPAKNVRIIPVADVAAGGAQ